MKIDHLKKFMDWLNRLDVPMEQMAEGMFIVSKWLEDYAKQKVTERDMSQRGQDMRTHQDKT